MLVTQKIIVNKNKEVIDMLKESTLIYNKALYIIRQEYFTSKQSGKIKTSNYNQLYQKVKIEQEFQNSKIDYVVKQQIIKQVINNWKAFIKATISYKHNPKKFQSKPKIPKYLKNGKLNLIEASKFRLSKSVKDNQIKILKSNFIFNIPKYIQKNKIKIVRILDYYNKLKCEVIYQKQNVENKLKQENFIGIDLGLNNLCAITSNNQNKSWIIKGGKIKSINQFYNKKLSQFKSQLALKNNLKISKRIKKLNYKRNQKIEYNFHVISKKIIQLCLKNYIKNIVIGHNEGWKQDINIGKRNNQNFVQTPFNNLINKIKYKAQLQSINVHIVQQSYTSKVDHLVLQSMQHHDKYLGKRKYRGLFKSSCGKLINADINGAIGILRKANVFSDVQLLNLRNRGDVVSPQKLYY